MIDVQGEPARDDLPDTTGGAGQSDAALYTMIEERLMAEIKQLRADIDELASMIDYVIWLKERAK